MAPIAHKNVLITRAFYSDAPVVRRAFDFIRGRGIAPMLLVEGHVRYAGNRYDELPVTFITFGRAASALSGFLRMGQIYNLDYIPIDDIDNEVLQLRVADQFFDARFDLYEPEDIGQYVGVLTGASSISDRMV